MITVYTVAYNEEVLIQFMIDHYRTRFPGCKIVVYDNMSTDNTAKIARANNCDVVPFDTNNEFQDRRHMKIKNSCWKNADTDWVLMSDLDELLDINEAQLITEEELGTSMIRSEVYDMINMKNDLDIQNMKYGVKSPIPSKLFLFNKKLIRQINYGAGAHTCNPIGTICYSNKIYKAYHYASIGEDVTINKFKIYKQRLSKDNIENGWGVQYFMTPEEIRQEYAEERAKAIRIR
jgi:hypothetical protein